MNKPESARAVHVYDWDQEPVGGRRSEFSPSEFAATSTFERGARLHAGVRPPSARARFGVKSLLVFVVGY